MKAAADISSEIFYQNLPIPSDINAIPAYVNNELVILGNVISNINDNTVKITTDQTSIVDTIANNTTEVTNQLTTVNNSIVVLGNTVTINNNNTNANIARLDTSISELETLASDAANNAVAANSDLADMASDNIITQSEKSRLYIDWKAIHDEYTDILNKAVLYNEDTQAYSNSYFSLYNYLTSYPISIDAVPADGSIWVTNPANIMIDGIYFRSKFSDYYNQRQFLLNSISETANTMISGVSYDTTVLASGVDDIIVEITNIASDNILSQNEKNTIFIDWKRIYDEYTDILTKATAVSVPTTTYTTAYTTLATYLTSAPISIENPPTTGAVWCADTTSITIVGTDFRANFVTYYTERQLVLNAIDAANKVLADNAQSAANAAATNATTAINGINDILNDGKITQDEKPTIFMDWKAIYDEKTDITAKATSYSVSTTNYTAAYNTLATYLTSSPISIDAVPTTGATWCASSTVIAITGTTFRGNFTSYYNERQLVLNAIAAAAKVLADNAQATANTANTNATNAVNTANSAATTASGAATAAADRLSKSTNNVLSGSAAIIAGTLVINSSGARTSGSGVAITSTGLAGFNSSGTSTFAIDTAGNATFAGALSAATGSFAGSLSAVTGSFGAVAVSSTGSISAGKTSATDVTSGFWMSGGATPKFNIGNSTNSLIYDGSTLTINGGGTFSGSLNAATGVFNGSIRVGSTDYATSNFLNSNVTATSVGLGNVSNLTPQNQAQTGLIAGTTITGGGITMSAGGTIKGGKTSFSDTTNDGFIIGYGAGVSANQYGFKFGKADMTQGIYWDGSTLTIKGDLTGSTGVIANSLSVGTTPAVSGTTMTGSGAIFNSGGTFAVGNSTTNISFNGTTMTLNGSVVANGNLATNSVSTVKVGANQISSLLKTTFTYTSFVTTGSWQSIGSWSFTVPTLDDGTTTLDALINICGDVYNKDTTSARRAAIGIGFAKNTAPTTNLHSLIYNFYINAASMSINQDPLGGAITALNVTDTCLVDQWIHTGLVQGASYTITLNYWIATANQTFWDHGTATVAFFKR